MRAGQNANAAAALGLAVALLAAGCATPIEIPGNADPNGPPYGKLDASTQTRPDAASAGMPDGRALQDSGAVAERGSGVIDGDGGTADGAGGDAQPARDGGDARAADAGPTDGLLDLDAGDAATHDATSGGNDV